MPVERIIAVDFGTSTSVVRVKRYQDGQPVGDRLETKPVTFNMGSTVVPTLIQKRDTQESLYFGYDAEIPRKNTEICRNFKIEVESPDSAVRERARGLTAEFFGFLFKSYREQSLGGHLGESSDQERTIISYPVKWSEETKAFMLETARNAGFPNVEGQDEAQAAIQAVTVQSEQQMRDRGYFVAGMPVNILLIDMGAGTTDLVLCRHTPGDTPQTEILSTWPHGASALFGGREVDELLRSYIKSLLPAEDADKVLKKLGADKFKAWKEHEVSPALARGETVDYFSALDDRLEDLEIDVDYPIDRQTFEDFAQDYLRGLPELINGCLQKAEVNGDDVDLVIVTGGHSQWYFVREILSGKLNQFGDVGLQKMQADPGRIISIALPQETVALGLAYGPLRVDVPAGTQPVEEGKKREIDKLCKCLQAINSSQIHGTAREDVFPLKYDPYSWIRPVIAAGSSYTIGLKKDGTAIAVGTHDHGQCNVSNWRDVVAIASKGMHSIGLKKDGTVVAAGANINKCCNVSGWRDIVAVAAGVNHTVGLKKDGTVIEAGDGSFDRSNVNRWQDIIAIVAANWHTVGLKKDGTVVAVGSNIMGCCNVGDWRNIVAIAAGFEYTVGLKEDGTVIATGNNKFGQCNVSEWRDIVAIAAGKKFTIGLKRDGMVVAVGSVYHRDVSDWCDIVAIAAGISHAVGLKKDGTLVGMGDGFSGQTSFGKYEIRQGLFFGPKLIPQTPWKLF